MVCIRPEGIEAGTYVQDYLGELYAPWRWYERQDAIKKREPGRDLPDFFNITLERPAADAAGYDVLFVEAAHRCTFASRLSHSCAPNCHTVVVSVGGKLTIAQYATRKIEYGEELCWNYSCVTESEKEYRAAMSVQLDDVQGGVFGFRGVFGVHRGDEPQAQLFGPQRRAGARARNPSRRRIARDSRRTV